MVVSLHHSFSREQWLPWYKTQGVASTHCYLGNFVVFHCLSSIIISKKAEPMIHDDHIHKPLTLFTPLTHFAEVRRASLHLLEKLGGVRVLKGSSGQQLVNEGKASMFGCLPDPLWLVGTASLRRYVWHSWNAGNVQGGAMLQLSWLSFPDRLSVATFVSLLGLGQADFSSHSNDLYHSGDKNDNSSSHMNSQDHWQSKTRFGHR